MARTEFYGTLNHINKVFVKLNEFRQLFNTILGMYLNDKIGDSTLDMQGLFQWEIYLSK